MTSVLVTGATGFLGKYVMDRCAADADLHAVAGSRTGQGPWSGPQMAYGNLDDLENLQAMLSGIDVVVHCAGRAHVLRETDDDPLPAFMKTNCDAAVHLATQAAAAGVKRFVFISSIGVLGNQTHGAPFQADDPPAPHAPYAVSKLAAEQALKDVSAQTGLELVILRPPLILGPDPIGNLGSLVRVMRKGLPLPFGLATRNKRSLVHVQTVADLIAVVCTHPKAAGETFLVADAPALSTKGIILSLADIEGISPKLLPVPVSMLKVALRALGKTSLSQQLFGDLELDITHTERTLDWVPPVSSKS